MKKNIIMLTISLLFLTGCTINYSVEFDDDLVNENISGYVTSDEIGDGSKGTGLNIYYDLLYNDQFVLSNGDDLYKKNINKKGNKVYYDFEYVYDDNYKDSRILNDCYENVIFDEYDDFYYVHLSGDFLCMYADKINVSVISKNAIIDSNADVIKNNEYIWKIKNENDADINLIISKTLKNGENVNSKKRIHSFRVIIFIILIVLSFITYLLYKKTNSDGI